ncbi:VgrG-related protein [Streptomyces murinus]|uniref:VgrG-related protein n=1 Tax=Streptomyces murinus TaxID=33900 RepID=UPI00382A92DA
MTDHPYTAAAQPRISIGSDGIPKTWQVRLVEAFVDTGINLPAEAYLRFRDPQRNLFRKLGASIGAPLTVAVTTKRNYTEKKIFGGEITSLERAHSPSDGTFSIVRAKDLTHRLFRGRHVTAYADATVADVAKKIADRAGLALGTVNDDGTRIPHLSQPNLTDWELLQHLAAERGLTVAVEDRKLCLRKYTSASTAPKPRSGPATDPFVLVLNRNLLSLQAALTSTGQVAKVHVHGWDPTAKEPLNQTVDATSTTRQLRDSDSKAPWAFVKESLKERPTLHVTSRPYTSAHAVTTAAKALASDVAAGSAQLTAVAVGTPQLTAGEAVTLSKAGPPFDGKYTITTCRHVFDSNGYRTVVGVSVVPSSPVPDAPPLSITGMEIGVVTATRDPNRDNQNGEVKLKFPWLGSEYETGWVRTMQYGGVGGGGVIPYTLEDEVLVGFVQGRLDQPVVVGGLYNGKDMPSDHDGVDLYDDSGKPQRRSLASRDSDRIEILTPAEGAQGIRLTTGKDKEKLIVLLDRDKKAISLTAGVGEENLSLLFDYANKFAVLSSGTGESELTLLLDHGKKNINIEAGTGKEKLGIRLDRENKGITLDAGPQGTLTLKAATVKISHPDETAESERKFIVNSNDINMVTQNKITLDGKEVTIKGDKVDIN